MSALDSLYGGGIAANAIGGGLQGLVEGYKLKRGFDIEEERANAMEQWRKAQGGMNDAHAGLLQEQIDRLQHGLSINGSQPGGRGGSASDRAALLSSLTKTPYGSDPNQLTGAYNALQEGGRLPNFVPPAARPVAAAPADPGWPSLIGAKIRSMLSPAAPAAPAQQASVLPMPGQAPAPAQAGAPGYDWRKALKQ